VITPCLRLARLDDAAAIDAAGYEGALYHHRGAPNLLAPPVPSSREWSEAALAPSPQSTCFVAEVGDQVVGYVHVAVVEESRPIFVTHRYGNIESVAVMPQFQSQGIGAMLLDAAEDWLSGRKCKIARLSVFASNDRATALHVNRGYGPVVTMMEKRLVP
jgi:ribosomal protein S18 acetylase RimI-like enzyme